MSVEVTQEDDFLLTNYVNCINSLDLAFNALKGVSLEEASISERVAVSKELRGIATTKVAVVATYFDYLKDRGLTIKDLEEHNATQLELPTDEG